MNRLTRRALLGKGSAGIVLLALLTRCGVISQADIQQAITDAGLVIGSTTPPPGTGLEGAYAAFKAANPNLVSTAVDAQIQAAFAQCPTYLAALSAAAAATTNATNLSALVSVVSQILSILAPIVTPLLAASNPAVAGLVIAGQAVTALLPVIQATIAELAPTKAAAAPAVPAIFVNPAMTPATARAKLA